MLKSFFRALLFALHLRRAANTVDDAVKGFDKIAKDLEAVTISDSKRLLVIAETTKDLLKEEASLRAGVERALAVRDNIAQLMGRN